MVESHGSGSIVETLLTDLPKNFDCLLYQLLGKKTFTASFDISSTRFFLNNRIYENHRTKIADAYSSRESITSGVSQGSTFEPLLFSINLCDLLFILNSYETASYMDDNTPYVTGETIESVVELLEKV